MSDAFLDLMFWVVLFIALAVVLRWQKQRRARKNDQTKN